MDRYNGQQGVGYATILDNSTVRDFSVKNFEKEAAARERKKAEANKKLGSITMPEHFWKHNQEISEAFTNVIDQGAKLIDQGIDPFNEYSERTKKFQQDWQKLGVMGDHSIQLRDTYNKGRNLFQTDSNKYDGFEDFQNFFDENSLNDIVDKGLNAPTLMKRKALKEINDFHKGNVVDLLKLNNGQPLQGQALKDYADKITSDPGVWTELKESYDAKFAQLGDDQKQILRNKAEKNGVDIYRQAIMDDAEMWNAEAKPFNLTDNLDAIAATLKTRRTKIEEGDVTTMSENVSDQQIKDAIKERLASEPRLADGLKGDPVEAVFKRYKGMIRNRVATKFEKTLDEGGKLGGLSSKEYKAQRERWLKDVNSGVQEAADYLRRYKPPGEDLTVYKTKHKGNNVIMYMRGKGVENMKNKPLFDKEIEKGGNEFTFGDGEEGWKLSDNFTPVGLRGDAIYLPAEDAIVRVLDVSQPDDSELLYEMYDTVFKKHGNKPYSFEKPKMGILNRAMQTSTGKTNYNQVSYE